MSSKIVNKSVRKVIRELDARHSDVYIGFNDLDSIVFENSATLNYSLNLPSGSSFIQNGLSATLYATGNVRKGVADNEYLLNYNFLQDSFSYPSSSFVAYNDYADGIAAISNDSFYASGSALVDTNFGFNVRLSSKEKIRKDFLNFAFSNPALHTASISYYNTTTQRFVKIAEDLAKDPSQTGDTSFGWDATLFNAAGMAVTTGSASGFFRTTPALAADRAFNADFSQDELNNSSFSGSSDYVFDLSDQIDEPFLVEKVELNVVAFLSESWMQDITQFNYVGDASGDAFADFGGSAITFFLLRQISEDRREIICSGSVVSYKDNQKTFTTGLHSTAGLDLYESPAGFSSFGTPALVVTGNVDTGFTGDLSVKMVPAVSNGVMAYTFSSQSLTYVDEPQNGFAASISRIGRNKSSRNSGRSLFGKELGTVPLENTSSLRYTANYSNVAHNDIHMLMFDSPSPYLIYPDDKLILGYTKHRPVIADLNDRSVLTSSFESNSILIGANGSDMTLDLYGARVSNLLPTTKKHKRGNANARQSIGDFAVLDQYEVENTELYSGSIYTQLYTGSMTNSTRRVRQDAARIYKENNKNNDGYFIGTFDVVLGLSRAQTSSIDLFSVRRTAQVVSENERYYDTLLPDVTEMFAIDGKSNAIVLDDGALVDITEATNGNVIDIQIGKVGTQATGTIANDTHDFWDYVFPFEPRYASAGRFADFSKKLSTTRTLFDSTPIPRTFSEFISVVRFYDNDFGNSNPTSLLKIEYGGVQLETNDNILPTRRSDIAAKGLFGFGNGEAAFALNSGLVVQRCNNNNYTKQPRAIANSYFEDQVNDLGYRTHVDYELRGFKYGLLNTRSVKKTYHWRQGKYGQFRDMLEQAHDSKIFNEKTGKVFESPVFKKFTTIEPENSFTSNLSFEATSSLPYFDDNTPRNRGAVPDSTFLEEP